MKFPSRCCQAFVLPFARSVGELREEFKRNLRYIINRDDKSTIRMEDIATLQFLIPLTLKDIDEELLSTFSEDSQECIRAGGTVWSCKYIDPNTGVCGIYDSRPSMCRIFPENDTDNMDEHGINTLCHNCSSTYCSYHPEKI